MNKFEKFVYKQRKKLGFYRDYHLFLKDSDAESERVAEAREKHPLEYFVYVSLFDKAEDLIYYATAPINNAYYFLRNGFKGRHIVKVGKFGDYLDSDTMICNGLQKILFSFIEKECDHMYRISFPEKVKKDKQKNKKLNYGRTYLKAYINDKESSKELKKAYDDILDSFDYFKSNRKLYLKKIKKAEETYDVAVKKKSKRNNAIKKLNDLETFLYKEDSKYYKLIIEHRGYMWT